MFSYHPSSRAGEHNLIFGFADNQPIDSFQSKSVLQDVDYNSRPGNRRGTASDRVEDNAIGSGTRELGFSVGGDQKMVRMRSSVCIFPVDAKLKGGSYGNSGIAKGCRKSARPKIELFIYIKKSNRRFIFKVVSRQNGTISP